MLDINLIPVAFQKKTNKSLFPAGFHIPIEVVIGLGGFVFGAIFLVNLVLFFTRINKAARYGELKKEWQTILPEKEDVDAIINDMRQLETELKTIQSVAAENHILWSEKLNIISDQLPHGVWLKEINLKDDVFMLEGSTMVKENAELINVHRFTSNLKKDPHFLDHLTSFELGSIQRRAVGHVDIVDFLLTTKIK